MIKGNRAKSMARKPLVDISNGGKPSRISKKRPTDDVTDGGGALDRLLLARSELSSLFVQIDELVAQAMGNGRMDRKASQDIESFRNVLSDMHSSLKPWVSRLRQAFSSTLATGENQLCHTKATSCANDNEENAFFNINETELDLIVSPSPLVSWRAGACAGAHTMESGKQLFLLTPLPKSKVASSKSTAKILHEENQHTTLELPRSACHDLLGRMKMEIPPANVPKPCAFESGKQLFLLSPLPKFKVASSKSMAKILPDKNQHITLGLPQSASNDSLGKMPKPSIAESNTDISESCSSFFPLKCNGKNDSATSPPESTCVTENNDPNGSDDLTDDALEDLTLRYRELLGLHPSNNFTSRRKEVSQTLDWFFSPPKTCVIMEPADEKPLPTPANNGVLFPATPLWNNVGSTVRRGKRPGESTLKKELWDRFEQVSGDGLHFDASVFQKTEGKVFLDMLEEACEAGGDGW